MPRVNAALLEMLAFAADNDCMIVRNDNRGEVNVHWDRQNQAVMKTVGRMQLDDDYWADRKEEQPTPKINWALVSKAFELSYFDQRKKEDYPGREFQWYQHPVVINDAGRAFVVKFRDQLKANLVAREKREANKVRKYLVTSVGTKNDRVLSMGETGSRIAIGTLCEILREGTKYHIVRVVKQNPYIGYDRAVQPNGLGNRKEHKVRLTDVASYSISPTQYDAMLTACKELAEWQERIDAEEELLLKPIQDEYNRRRKQRLAEFEATLADAIGGVKP